MKKMIFLLLATLGLAGAARADMLVNLPPSGDWVTASTNFNNKDTAVPGVGIPFTTNDMLRPIVLGGANVTTNQIFGGYKFSSGAVGATVSGWGVVNSIAATPLDYFGAGAGGAMPAGESAAVLYMVRLTQISTVTNVYLETIFINALANYTDIGIRIVVQQGANYYASDPTNFISGTRVTNMTAAALAGHTWYNYAPGTDLMTIGSPVSSMNFSNIAAVGEYIYAKNIGTSPTTILSGGGLRALIVQGVPGPAVTNPVLSASGTVATNVTGKFRIAETNVATVTINNSGTAANNVTAQLVLPSGGFFTATSTTNLSFGTVATSASSNITLIAAANTPPGTYTFGITNLSCNAVFFQKTAGSFNLTISQGVTVSGQTNNTFILPPADFNQTVTNTSMVISNSTILPLVCTFTHSAPWLTEPLSGSSITIPPKGASNVVLIGNSPDAGQFSKSLGIAYDQVVTNFTSFAVQFNVGPKISYQASRITEISGGVIANKYEPGERLTIAVSNVNDGATTVTDITNSLANTSGLFTIVPLTAPVYASMTVGAVSSTLYQVDISQTAPDGTQTFTVVNSAGTVGAWTNTFTLDVFNRPAPSASPSSLIINVPAGGTNSATLTLNNNGNLSTTFKLTDNGAWPVTYSVQTQTASLASFPPIPALGPNTNNTFVNWSGNSSALMNIGFAFPLYGTAYSTFSVSRYGAVSFGTTVGANTTSPFALPSGSIPLAAPFWGNTAVDINSVRYMKQPDKLILAWGNRTGHEFQAWIYTNGNIRYLYEQTTWGDGAIGIQQSSNSLNAAYTPGNGSESVLLAPQSNPWVTPDLPSGTLNALSSRIITYTANAAGLSAGTTNTFNVTVTWGDGSSSVVAVKVVVGASSPSLSAPTEVTFYGPAGDISKTTMTITNTGDAALNYVITDTGAQGAGYAWTSVPFNWDTSSGYNLNSGEAVFSDGGTNTAWMPIGFAFPFYGNTYSRFKIDTYGFIVLNPANNRFIDAYFARLNLDENTTVRYAGTANKLIVTWQNIRQLFVVGGQTNAAPDQTFQMVLYKNGNILLQYLSLTDSNAWPIAKSGLWDTTTRQNYATLSNSQTTITVTNYTVVTNKPYNLPVVTTNGTNVVVSYKNTVTDQAILFTPAAPIIISVDPVSGTLPVGKTQVVDIYGDARNLPLGGTNLVIKSKVFQITSEATAKNVTVSFGAINSAETSFADTDVDGMSDLKETLAGTDANSADSIFGVSVARSADGSRTVSWPKANDNLSRTYAVWYTTNLMSGWTELYRDDNFTSYTDKDHPNVPVIYYKVTVQ